MIILILTLISSLNFSYAGDFFCSSFKDCDSSTNQGSSSKSLPSNSSATNFNSSNVAHISGFGVELLYEPNNPFGYNLLTGNGSIGAALLNPIAEDSFFGNRAIEIDDVYAQRRIDKKRYRTKKLSLAFGGSLVNEDYLGLDMGVSLKRNPDLKKLNPGASIAARFFFLNIGANFYKDDTKLEFGQYKNPATGATYASQYNSSTYSESFLVKNYSAGLNFGSLTFDIGLIKTKYDFYPNETSIFIYSTSYRYDDFLFNLAYRIETSDNLKESGGTLYKDREKKDYYGGIQYSWNSHITTGIAYNNFLVHDISMTLSLFL